MMTRRVARVRVRVRARASRVRRGGLVVRRLALRVRARREVRARSAVIWSDAREGAFDSTATNANEWDFFSVQRASEKKPRWRGARTDRRVPDGSRGRDRARDVDAEEGWRRTAPSGVPRERFREREPRVGSNRRQISAIERAAASRRRASRRRRGRGRAAAARGAIAEVARLRGGRVRRLRRAGGGRGGGDAPRWRVERRRLPRRRQIRRRRQINVSPPARGVESRRGRGRAHELPPRAALGLHRGDVVGVVRDVAPRARARRRR